MRVVHSCNSWFSLPVENVHHIWLLLRLSKISCFLPKVLHMINSFLPRLSMCFYFLPRVSTISHISHSKTTHGCHLSFISKFPDFSLTFHSFPYPLTDQKIIFILYFNNGADLLGSKIFPLRVLPNEEGDGLRLPPEKVHPLPS